MAKRRIYFLLFVAISKFLIASVISMVILSNAQGSITLKLRDYLIVNIFEMMEKEIIAVL